MAKSPSILINQTTFSNSHAIICKPSNDASDKNSDTARRKGPDSTALKRTPYNVGPIAWTRTKLPQNPKLPDAILLQKESLRDANIFEGNSTVETSFTTLDCTHWLEVMDERHRYGTYLRSYYDAWLKAGAPDAFFTWLDEGDGLKVDVQKLIPMSRKVVSRENLEESRVRYCSIKEREQYRAVILDGRLVWASLNAPDGMSAGDCVDTRQEPKWIFVIDVSGKLYVNRKRKFSFHHSSFVSGAPVRAAGRISVKKGRVICLGPNSGHYRTTWEQLVKATENFFGRAWRIVPPMHCDSHGEPCVIVLRKSIAKQQYF